MKQSRTWLQLAIALSLVLTTGACGQLPPDQAAELSRSLQGGDASRNNPNNPTIVVNTLQWNSTGNLDLQYLITYLTSAKTFSIRVSRSENATINKTVQLSSADSPDLYAALLNVFAANNKVTLTPRAVPPPNYTATVDITRNDSTRLQYGNPLLQAASTPTTTNLFDTLNQFILNRL